MFWILRVVTAIVLIVWIFRQVRKPSGPLGRRVVRAMNLSHSRMTDWGLQQVTVAENAIVLDIGCGGGRTVRKLASLAPAGKVVALDYSAASVAVVRETNAQEIAAGRVQIERGRWPRCHSWTARSKLSPPWKRTTTGPTCLPMCARF